MGREGVFFKGSILVETSTGLPQGSQEAEQLTFVGAGLTLSLTCPSSLWGSWQ